MCIRDRIKAKTDYFFPRQIWKDIVGMITVFFTICALAFWEPVVLLEEATPDPGDYHPEPEWYFLFLSLIHISEPTRPY